MHTLSSNAHVSQRKFCAMKPAASLARTRAICGGKKTSSESILNIVEERIRCKVESVFFLPPLIKRRLKCVYLHSTYSHF